MRTPTILTTLVACVLLLALPSAAAWANAADDRIVEDCQTSPTGALRGSYSQAQLNHALHHLPSDASEYTGCSDAIRQALLAGAGGRGDPGSGGGGGGGGTGGGTGGTNGGIDSTGGGGTAGAPATSGTGASGAAPESPPPAGAEQPVDVAGAAVAPGALPEIGSSSHRLPTPLLVLLVLLGLAAIAAAALTIGRRVVTHRRA